MYPSPNKNMNRRPLGPPAPGSFHANQPGAMNQNGQGPQQPSNPYKGGMASSTIMQPPNGIMSPVSGGSGSPNGALTPPPMSQPPTSTAMMGEDPSQPTPILGGAMAKQQGALNNQHQMQPMTGDPSQSGGGVIPAMDPTASNPGMGPQSTMASSTDPSMPPPPSPYQRQDMPNQVQKQRKLVPQTQ